MPEPLISVTSAHRTQSRLVSRSPGPARSRARRRTRRWPATSGPLFGRPGGGWRPHVVPARRRSGGVVENLDRHGGRTAAHDCSVLDHDVLLLVRRRHTHGAGPRGPPAGRGASRDCQACATKGPEQRSLGSPTGSWSPTRPQVKPSCCAQDTPQPATSSARPRGRALWPCRRANGGRTVGRWMRTKSAASRPAGTWPEPGSCSTGSRSARERRSCAAADDCSKPCPPGFSVGRRVTSTTLLSR